MFDRPSEDHAWIEFELPDRTMMHLLVGNQTMCAIEKQDTQHFLRERPHRGHEILRELRTSGVDWLGADFNLKAFKDEFARPEQDSGNVLMLPKDALECLWRLRANSADVAKFMKKRVG